MYMKTMPLIRTYKHNSRKLPLRGLPYHHREIAFERVVDYVRNNAFW